MKLPRDLGGRELAKKLERYGYRITRQVGSHLRLASTTRGKQHHVTNTKRGMGRYWNSERCPV